jgi:hypothetical protein
LSHDGNPDSILEYRRIPVASKGPIAPKAEGLKIFHSLDS